ncbi:unnamed protein product [Phytophthora lilii]|uniref:Unnamed protein product n=1 Tax=Phytophthora lilii TaxID=2077276 RepID=A0A9W6TH40_9STRA|nr:unnamed protein product [Phytophthora lilii]
MLSIFLTWAKAVAKELWQALERCWRMGVAAWAEARGEASTKTKVAPVNAAPEQFEVLVVQTTPAIANLAVPKPARVRLTSTETSAATSTKTPAAASTEASTEVSVTATATTAMAQTQTPSKYPQVVRELPAQIAQKDRASRAAVARLATTLSEQPTNLQIHEQELLCQAAEKAARSRRRFEDEIERLREREVELLQLNTDLTAAYKTQISELECRLQIAQEALVSSRAHTIVRAAADGSLCQDLVQNKSYLEAELRPVLLID